MNPAPRRAGLQAPGTQLLLDEDVVDASRRARAFSEFSGIAVRDMVLTPLSSLPVPIYNFATTPDGRATGLRRWEGARPEAMWHPLMWLPPRLTRRFRYKDLSGHEVYESDHLWAARIAMELHASGLYDSETGEWVDVLAMSGLDVTDELDLARVEDWLTGDADGVLDEISLAGFLNEQDPTWALISLLALEDVLWQASWAMTAETLVELVLSSLAVDVDLAAAAGSVASSMGLSLLARSEAVGGPSALAERFLSLHADLEERLPGSAESRAALDELVDLLHGIRDAHWPALESLHTADAA